MPLVGQGLLALLPMRVNGEVGLAYTVTFTLLAVVPVGVAPDWPTP